MKHFNQYLSATFLLFATAFLFSCKKDTVTEVDPTVGLTKVWEGYVPGAAAKLQLYGIKSSVKTGYNQFYIQLFDSTSNARIEDAHINVTPMMDMGMMQHSAPVENPEEEAVNRLFPLAVTFIMPSSATGAWTLETQVHNHLTDKEGEVTIPVSVSDPAKATVKSFTSLSDGSNYFVALIEPSKPVVGINTLAYAVYKKESMMSFVADSSLSFQFVPTMPSMGHSSPNNIQPTHSGGGHYTGKVNFTMTGLWQLDFRTTSGTAVADSTMNFVVEF